ncbi:MAG: hypothetical protein J5658_03775 [Prevotella sp.]|nr:hypothetical protein [Prevotella sp.]
MSIISRIFQDKFGNYLLPVTHERNVRDSEGVTLEAKLAALSGKTAIVAWDGASTPVVSRIPAGVVVTYNGTQYIGTMPPSASTDGITYMIKNGNNYDRYVSGLSPSNTRVWFALGSTAIAFEVVDNLEDGGRDKALSAEQGKVLKEMIEDKFVFLTQEEFDALTTFDLGKLYCTYEEEEE